MNDAPVQHLIPRQLGERWHCSVGHLANLRSAGDGPEYLKIGARVLYPLAAIEDYEAGSLVKASA